MLKIAPILKKMTLKFVFSIKKKKKRLETTRFSFGDSSHIKSKDKGTI